MSHVRFPLLHRVRDVATLKDLRMGPAYKWGRVWVRPAETHEAGEAGRVSEAGTSCVSGSESGL